MYDTDSETPTSSENAAPGAEPSEQKALIQLTDQGELWLASSGLAAPHLTQDMLDSIPRIGAVQAEQGIPEHVPTQALLDRDIALMAWREQEALLVETGEKTDGFFTLVYLPDERRYVTTYIGAMVLTRTIRTISPPVRVTLQKRGRTLTFI